MPVLEPVGEDLWIADGGPVSFLGFVYPTRMAVARLASGALWIWSPVALTRELREEIAALGEPRYAVEPNSLHHLALADWVKAWPALRLWAPPRLAKKRRDLTFDAELGDDAPAEWRDEIDHAVVRGSVALTEVLFFHRASRACLVGDLVQKFEPSSVNGWRGWVMRADSLVGDDGSTPREWRATFLRRALARAAVDRVLARHPEHLVIAHGRCAMQDGEEVLRRSLRWLW